MVIWLSLGIFVLGFIMMGLAAGLSKGEAIDNKFHWLIGFGVTFSIISLIALAIFGIATISLVADAVDLEAFYKGNASIYQTAAVDTKTLLSETQQSDVATILIQGSIEKVGVGMTTADRIRELREETTKYNNKLAFYRLIKQNIWLSILYPDIPPDLRYIRLSD